MMFRTAIRMTLAASLFAGVASVGFAQSTTEGAIAGTAEDVTGAVIPKAVVVIKNTGTAATQNLTADDSGYFKAPLLSPGSYSVTVSATGFGNFQQKVEVVVGKLTEVMPRLTSGSTETTVDVSADVPVMNFESPDVSATLDREAIDAVPVQNRRWSALALTSPGVVADSSGFGLVSVRGMSTLFNNVMIDGADDNQAYYSEERGRTREAYSTSENAVQEFDVNTGVYSAQYGRAAGGVINSVTRSGSNQLHGELFFNDLDRGFGAYVPGSVSATGAPLKPKDLRKIYGGSVGGHLIKDKLFWFYTYDQHTHTFPGISRPRSYGSAGQAGTFLEQPDPTVTSCTENAQTGAVTVVAPAGTVHTALDSLVCALSFREKLGSYAAGAVAYNNGVNALLTDVGTVPRVGYQEINTPKLDYQITPKERVSFLFHRLRWDAPGDVQTSAAAYYSLDAFGNDFVKLDYGVAKLISQVNPHFSNELLYQYSRELNDEGQQPYSQYTLNNLVATGKTASGMTNGPGGTIPYINLNQSNYGFYLGSPYYSYRQALPDEHKWQIFDTLYQGGGDHSIRYGIDIVHNNDVLHQDPYYFGYYSYSNIANYLSDLASKGSTSTCNASGAGVGVAPYTTSSVNDTVGSYGCYSTISQDFGATNYQIATVDVAGFVQDNWKVNKQLTLELGLRYDVERLAAPSSALTTATGTFVPYAALQNLPHDNNNFGPRIGFAFDMFGTGKTVLRGGYGLYYGRVLNGSILNVLFGTGSPLSQYATASLGPATSTTVNGVQTFTTTAAVPTFPNPIASAGGSKPSSFFFAPNLQVPQVDEATVGIQQDMGSGHIFTVTYLGGFGRTLPNFLNVNLAAPPTTCAVASASCAQITISDTTGAGPIANGSSYLVPTFSTANGTNGYNNPNFSNISELISNITSNYNAVTFEIQNHSHHMLQYDANYTWAHALDFNQNPSATTATNGWLNPYANARQNYGISQFNVGNRFVGYVLYNIPGYNKNHMMKYVTGGWAINDTFQMQNGLPYSANIGSNRNSSGALNTGTWNGVNSVTYVPVLGLNRFQGPHPIIDDARLQKSFPITERYTLQLSADMYNVANHQNLSVNDITTTAYNFVSASTTATGSVLQYSPRNGTTGFGAHSTSNDSGFLFTPREFQIMARLEF